ncbi:hypothetical protein [Corynebacterium argentoratense]
MLNRKLSQVVVVISGTIAATCLVACGDDSQDTSDTLVVTAQPTNPDNPDPAPFVAQQVEPIVAPTLYEPIHDPGLNVDWTLRGVSAAPIGGIVVHVDVKNLNESALPTDVVKATLKTTGYNGQSTNIEPLGDGQSGVQSGLDLPLGSGATTNLDFAFNTTVGNVNAAELQVGNVIFKGSLNI